MPPEYTIVRIDESTLRLDRATPPYGPVAFALLNRDRSRTPIGWRLKPIKVVRASKSALWPSPEAAFASTKLITASEARAAIHALDNPSSKHTGAAP